MLRDCIAFRQTDFPASASHLKQSQTVRTIFLACLYNTCLFSPWSAITNWYQNIRFTPIRLKRQPEKKAGILREVLSHRQMQAEVA
jgi:hypothetical protein